jgi:hypothetical protein
MVTITTDSGSDDQLSDGIKWLPRGCAVPGIVHQSDSMYLSRLYSSLLRLAVSCSLDSSLKSFGQTPLLRRTAKYLTASPTLARAMADHVLPIPSVGQPSGHAASSKPKLYILDYGAGNVRR